MAPYLWWAKETHRGTPVVVKMENPNNWSMVELESPSEEDFIYPNDAVPKGGRNKNAKQLTWVLLLKAHKAAGCLSSITSAFFSLSAAVRRRVVSGRTDSADAPRAENHAVKSRFFVCIKGFLWLSLILLGFELAAHFKGWHFQHSLTDVMVVKTAFDSIYSTWVLVRVEYLAPPLQFLTNVCIILFLIQSLDRLILCLGCLWIKIRKIKPAAKHGIVDLETGDGGDYFPIVLVQIPMCNEKEVYEQSIAAVCNLDWPKGRMLVQVLDDSDDPITMSMIKEDVHKWQQNGANIIYRHRVIRKGYKAGNLKSAMNCSYVKDFEFVTIFDADFQPNPDFLKRTIPHFKDNEDVGLVQARWSFVNKDENLLTRLQLINLAFHFEVEQQVNGIFLNFFGFNGTAGVWRIKALEDSGGWLERTTVEDMDIAVRAHLHGWKFVFLNDVECQCELPESYEAYRKQQHRWHSGPMQLFRLCLPAIVRSKVSDLYQYLEESQHDFPVLHAKKTNTPILLFHTFLYHTSNDHVCTRGYTSILGCLLYPGHHVVPQHTASSKIIPIHRTLPTLRKHHVCNQIQRHDLRPLPTWKCIRMGCHQEIRAILSNPWSRKSQPAKEIVQSLI